MDTVTVIVIAFSVAVLPVLWCLLPFNDELFVVRANDAPHPVWWRWRQKLWVHGTDYSFRCERIAGRWYWVSPPLRP